ncbi:Transcriptional regulator, LysR family [Candidatus Rhodobacter oscarellae]|uniref:Transcriptional regulator, LysR family n=1 Tax=Candidatus Rhodobacter oscarellae TaxID=1675527 RepID=A0A0J9ECJ3_9RHOB|nr:LysR substrate-binding domain-containing protein [Candidatus Rhodobacter lobularis]KMW60376.1 Transcriptional regulator, LysR family [Candidatus Rhodobacter lobularis]
MRYAQLRAFHHVALSGGFSRAAATLNQSQPSISDQVRKLEEAHDTLLFHRDTRQVRLTEAGQGLLRLTRRFFETEEEIAEYLDRNRAVPTGQLRIVADSAAHVTPAIGRFRAAHPGVNVSLWTGNTQEVLARLRNYDAEIGVAGNLGAAKGLDRVELERSPIVAIASHGLIPEAQDKIAFADLTNWPLIFREPGSRTREHLEAASEVTGVKLVPSVQVEGREAMRELVATGAGIGFLSEAEFGHDRRLRKFAIAGVDLGMSETLVTLSARRDVPVIRAFLRILA